MSEQDLSEEGEVKYIMKLSKDKKRFSIEMVSTKAMTPKQIVLGLEDFLYDNILEGRWPFEKEKEQ